MTMIVVEASAAIYLILCGLMMKVTGGGFIASVIFKIFPLSIGVILSFNVYAKYMGWPI